ncbi:MAG: BCD family MFS transporter [Chloroflexaceae bacterium]|jgi:BCD family chlorophyll transporter-like MFS transporter|nr:BCD family MFS transporter [Chloroflexaceae bacterium]
MAIGKISLGHVHRMVERMDAWLQARPELRRWLKVLRLGLFQFGMGLSLAPITGTLNRVLIDDMRIPAVAVALLIALHYFVSPTRALIGYRSDQYRAEGNWRTPYLVLGAMLTYGGLATAPFTLILLSGEGVLPFWPAFIFCLFIFLAYGLGVNIVETIFLALVSDITPPKERGRVLAVLWMMLVLGTVAGSFIIGQLLVNYSHVRLIQVMQGSAVAFIALTFIALLGQEKLNRRGKVESAHAPAPMRQTLRESVRMLWRMPVLRKLFVILFLATLGFACHDVLLEPYGGQVLGMSVAATSQLTAFWGMAMIVAVALSGWWLWRGGSSVALIMAGCAVGALGFLVISIASSAEAVSLFRGGVWLIGMGRGAFIVGSLALVMALVDTNHAGLFLGLWGLMQALAQGFGTIGSGLGRDLIQHATGQVALGYTAVYETALVSLVVALLLLAVLRVGRDMRRVRSPWAGLQEVPADQIVF